MTVRIELLGPNGAVVAPCLIGSQSGIDVLQNGGTSVDAAVAALAASLAESLDCTFPRNFSAIVAQTDPPLAISSSFQSHGELLDVWHSLLEGFGTRSLTDVLGSSPTSVRREQIGADGQTADASALGRYTRQTEDDNVLIRTVRKSGDLQVLAESESEISEAVTIYASTPAVRPNGTLADQPVENDIAVLAWDHRGVATGLAITRPGSRLRHAVVFLEKRPRAIGFGRTEPEALAGWLLNESESAARGEQPNLGLGGIVVDRTRGLLSATATSRYRAQMVAAY